MMSRRWTPKGSSCFLVLPKTSFSIFVCDVSSCGQALAQLPQASHLLMSAGVSLAYSRHLNGHVMMHAAQPVHFPVFSMFSSSDF